MENLPARQIRIVRVPAARDYFIIVAGSLCNRKKNFWKFLS